MNDGKLGRWWGTCWKKGIGNKIYKMELWIEEEMDALCVGEKGKRKEDILIVIEV